MKLFDRYFKKDLILFVCNSLVTLGGVEKVTLNQVSYLQEQGLQVEVCALRAVGVMANVFKENGIVVHFCHAYDAGETETLRIYPSGLRKLVTLLWRRRYGVVVAVQPPSCYLTRFACLPLMGRRVFAMEQTNVYLRKAKYHLFDRLCSYWTQKIICNSGLVKDGLRTASKVPGRKIVVIEDGFPAPEPMGGDSVVEGNLAEMLVFGCLSRMSLLKRQDVLVRAFANIEEAFPKARLVLVGDGETKVELEHLVRYLRLEEKVIFTGAVSNPHKYYPLFDIFVFPSVSEGFPGVMVEAWLHGLPIICADVRPMSDYVKHLKSGILFSADNVDDLSQWMRLLAEDSLLRREIGRNGLGIARSVFDYDQQMTRLHALIANN